MTLERPAADPKRQPELSEFAALADNLPEACWIADADGWIYWYNARWHQYTGTTPEQMRGWGWESVHDPATLPEVQLRWRHSISTGQPFEMVFPLRGADGIFRPFLTRIRPHRDEQGRITHWFGSNTEVRELQRALQEIEEQRSILQRLNDTAARFSGELNLERLVQAVTDAGVRLTGAQFGAFFYNVLDDKGESYTLYTISGVPRDRFSRFPMPRNTKIFDPTFRGVGVVRSDDITADPRYGQNAPYHGMPEGHLPVRSYLAVPVNSRTGEVLGGLFFGHAEPTRFTESHERLIVGVAAQAAIGIDNANLYDQAQREIERRRASEEARQVLVRELGHRVKNLFAVVNGMITASAKNASSPQELADRLRGRVEALARAHDLIYGRSANDIHLTARPAQLEHLLQVALAPFAGEDQRRIAGPEVAIGPRAATNVALIIHELATNASKYGGLAHPKGCVTLSWQLRGQRVTITWREQGGPPLSGPPALRGFGTQLVRMTASGNLSAEIRYDWKPEGVEVELDVPLAQLEA